MARSPDLDPFFRHPTDRNRKGAFRKRLPEIMPSSEQLKKVEVDPLNPDATDQEIQDHLLDPKIYGPLRRLSKNPGRHHPHR